MCDVVMLEWDKIRFGGVVVDGEAVIEEHI